MNKYKAIAIFTLGLLLGLSLMNLFHIHTLDRLYRIQNQLTTQLLDRDIKLERLSQNAAKDNISLVKDLKIEIDFDGNVLIKDVIEGNIRFYLSDLVGKELSQVDGEMIYKIFNSRILEIEDKKIRLTMKYLIIDEVITISVIGKVVD